MERLFPVIETLDDVRRLARGGAVAGLVFAVLVLLDGVLTAMTGSSYVAPGTRLLPVLLAGAEALLIIALSARVWNGRGYVSACLLLGLFVTRAAIEISGGLYAIGWAVMYFWAGLMMLNAVRACVRHEAFAMTPAEIARN